MLLDAVVDVIYITVHVIKSLTVCTKNSGTCVRRRVGMFAGICLFKHKLFTINRIFENASILACLFSTMSRLSSFFNTTNSGPELGTNSLKEPLVLRIY